MHDNIREREDKSVSSFETDAAALLAYALDLERYRRERAGRLYKYGIVVVCEKCLREYILDYAALTLERAENKHCELCDCQAPLLFRAYIVDSLKPRLETARRFNREGVIRRG